MVHMVRHASPMIVPSIFLRAVLDLPVLVAVIRQ